MKKLLMGLVIGFVLICLAVPVSAWGGRPPRDKKFNRERVMERITEKLGLSEEQQEKIKAHREKEKKEMASHHEEMKKQMELLKQEMQKDSPDRDVVKKLIKEMGQKRTEMELKRMDSLFELHQILTPAQRKEFRKMLEKRRPPEPGWRKGPGPEERK